VTHLVCLGGQKHPWCSSMHTSKAWPPNSQFPWFDPAAAAAAAAGTQAQTPSPYTTSTAPTTGRPPWPGLTILRYVMQVPEKLKLPECSNCVACSAVTAVLICLNMAWSAAWAPAGPYIARVPLLPRRFSPCSTCSSRHLHLLECTLLLSCILTSTCLCCPAGQRPAMGSEAGE
jgi:hypothetical protein